MPSNRDLRAGSLLSSWRRDRGLSPEALAWEIARDQRGFVSGRQIRRIETEGVIPQPRTQFALATFFGTSPSQVWTSPAPRSSRSSMRPVAA